ncbi:MAG: hypothetical protein HY301_07665 [Verrucomicrobia bacterium]|nr:hypothetical protein [Verrucomicrobiota bacterium]
MHPETFLRRGAGCVVAAFLFTLTVSAAEPARWWKGNLHTHSLWSDGDDYPEMITDWYRQHGYDFLGISDHNTLQNSNKWANAAKAKGGPVALEKYLKRFGKDWVEQRDGEKGKEVRLKRLEEYRGKFEEPGKFLLMQCEELTDRYKTSPIHMNVHNIQERIAPQGGDSVLEVMQNNVNAVFAQRERTGVPMIPHLNHPNFGWGVTAEELAQVKRERFFEVYNGHPTVHNSGDSVHASTDRIWDIVLTQRLGQLGLEPMFGMGTDDAHHYHKFSATNSNVGRGWIFVRATELTPEKLIAAMEVGDFYASSGVTLKEVKRSQSELTLEIAAEPGVTYVTEFIGTRKGYDGKSEPVRTAKGDAIRVTHRYSGDIGKVLATVKGTKAGYALKGDELYVRALVTSSKPKKDSNEQPEFERAWTQPVVK